MQKGKPAERSHTEGEDEAEEEESDGGDMMMVCLSTTKLSSPCMFWIPVNVSLFSGCNRQSAEDVIAEQAKQKEDDPFANLSKKEKKKKKKMVITIYSGATVYLFNKAKS